MLMAERELEVMEGTALVHRVSARKRLFLLADCLMASRARLRLINSLFLQSLILVSRHLMTDGLKN